MGLLLRPDVFYAESSYGVQLLGHDGPLALVGPSAWPLLEKVAPYLDGQHSLRDLTGGLPAERRAQVERLISALSEHGAVRELSGSTPPEPATGPFRYEVDYLNYFREEGSEAFTAYRATRVLLVGSGRLLVATEAAAVTSGLDPIRTVADPSFDRLGELIDELVGASGGLVLHASDCPAPERARALEKLCAAAGVSLAQALMADGAAWIAPIGVHWTSGWRRRRARDAPSADAVGTDSGTDRADAVSETAATAVAGRLVHGAFHALTGLVEQRSPRRRTALTRLDPDTLASGSHPFRPHPFELPAPSSETAQQFVDRIDALAASAPLEEEEFSRRTALATGADLGLIGEPEERDFVQVPLRVCAVEVSDPVNLLCRSAASAVSTPTVIAAGPDFATARYRAALRALASYGTLMADPRRMLGADDMPLCGPQDAPDEVLAKLTTSEGTEDGRPRVRGYRLTDARPVLLDACQVFPALGRATDVQAGQPAAQGDPVPIGAAAGYGWTEAVRTALLAYARTRTLAGIESATEPYPRIDLTDAPLDEIGARYQALLGAAGEDVTVYDVTGPQRVPTVVACRSGEPAGSASGPTMADALRDVLEQALLAYQSEVNGQPAYRPSPPEFPESLRGTRTTAVEAGHPLGIEELAHRLRDRTRHPVVVPLDHDPEVSSMVPTIVRVVFANA